MVSLRKTTLANNLQIFFIEFNNIQVFRVMLLVRLFISFCRYLLPSSSKTHFYTQIRLIKMSTLLSMTTLTIQLLNEIITITVQFYDSL